MWQFCHIPLLTVDIFGDSDPVLWREQPLADELYDALCHLGDPDPVLWREQPALGR